MCQQSGGEEEVSFCVSGRYSQTSVFFLFPPPVFLILSLPATGTSKQPFLRDTWTTLQQKPDLRKESLKNFASGVSSPAMESSIPVHVRGINFSLPTCGDAQCNSHGTCVPFEGGGTKLVCDCDLGYRGEFCENTVNGELSLPLTISVVAVIIGLLILAFIVAKLRQKQKQHRKLKATDVYC